MLTKRKPFYLVSEAGEFEKFDDLIIDYGESIIFLQAKHSSVKDQYSATDFCSNKDSDASLAKYFDSWNRLKNSKYSKTTDDKSKTGKYIFFTNRGIDNTGSFLKNLSLNNDEFLFKDLETKTYRFEEGKSRSKFIEAIRAYSDEVKNCKDTADDKLNLKDFENEFKDSNNRNYG